MNKFFYSLYARILVAVSLVGITTLICAGWLLSRTFSDDIEKHFFQTLTSTSTDLISASEVIPDYGFSLNWRPSDPRYNAPFSGWYWIIYDGNKQVIDASDSLPGAIDTSLLVTPQKNNQINNQNNSHVQLDGPNEQHLKAVVRKIRPLGSDQFLYYNVTGPISDVENDVKQFTTQLTIALALVTLAFIILSLLQLNWILRPLRNAKNQIQQIRSGQQDRLTEAFPKELKPLVGEINDLLHDNETIVERARLQASNLAHAIKNPLTVIRNESQQELSRESGKVIRQQIDKLNQNISRHLNRVRIAGITKHTGKQTPVEPVLEDIKESVLMIYKNKPLEIHISCPVTVIFSGDQQDLEELIGNLVDNACKWARKRINISATSTPESIRISIWDDGDGIPSNSGNGIFKAGTRLDESTAGQGLGLAIVSDIVAMYNGSIELTKKQDDEELGNEFIIQLPNQ